MAKKLIFILAAIVILFLVIPQVETKAQARPMMQQSLAPFKWQKRVILVFAANAADARWQRQQELLMQAQHELTTRDLLVLGILDNQVNASNAKIGKLPAPEALRDQYKVKLHEFMVILVGKDGTEKYRAVEIIKPGAIFHIIDAMPMRQQEMRRQ